MTPTDALAQALELDDDMRQRTWTPRQWAAHAVRRMPEGSAVVTVDALAAALGSVLGPEPAVTPKEAAAIIEACRS